MHRKSKYVRALGLGLVCTLLCLVWASACQPSRALAHFTPPSDARVLNVRDFGAIPNDSNDDTEAIQKAIVKALDRQSRYASPPFIFIPKGTYLLSDTLVSQIEKGGWSDGWRAGMIIMGV